MSEIHSSASVIETEAIGEVFAKKIKAPATVLLYGSLGAGKTAFTRGLARGFGFSGYVTSPSFAIVNEYIGGETDIFHFDLYRLSSLEELEDIGFYDYFSRGIMVIEWAERIAYNLEGDVYCVRIEARGDDRREIELFCEVKA